MCGLGTIRYTVAEQIARLNTNGGALTPALKSTTPNISVVCGEVIELIGEIKHAHAC